MGTVIIHWTRKRITNRWGKSRSATRLATIWRSGTLSASGSQARTRQAFSSSRATHLSKKIVHRTTSRRKRKKDLGEGREMKHSKDAFKGSSVGRGLGRDKPVENGNNINRDGHDRRDRDWRHDFRVALVEPLSYFRGSRFKVHVSVSPIALVSVSPCFVPWHFPPEKCRLKRTAPMNTDA